MCFLLGGWGGGRNQELWLPVMVPAHSTTIDLSMWHKEITGREVIAHAYFDFNDAPEMPGGPAGDKKYELKISNYRYRYSILLL